MNLYDELVGLIGDFVACHRLLPDLHRWLVAHVQSVASCRNEALPDLDAEAWTLIAEWQVGHRTVEAVRRELGLALEHEARSPVHPHSVRVLNGRSHVHDKHGHTVRDSPTLSHESGNGRTLTSRNWTTVGSSWFCRPI